jgi:ribosomal protein S18 acetylase RimI-like enzyme
MPGTTNILTLRPATVADQDFLKAVFADTRELELRALAWNPTQAQIFVDLQFNAQQQSYKSNYPSAENNIILLGELAIGRMLVDRSGDAIHLIDIAILSEYRNRTFGAILLERLLAEGTACDRAVELSVFKENPAIRLYKRLGFSSMNEDSAYIRMRKLPSAITSES